MFASKVNVVEGTFSVSLLFNIKGKGSWWFTSVLRLHYIQI